MTPFAVKAVSRHLVQKWADEGYEPLVYKVYKPGPGLDRAITYQAIKYLRERQRDLDFVAGLLKVQ